MSQTIDSTVVEQVNELADRARVASRRLALLSRAEKDAVLHQLADALVTATPRILEANASDLERGRENGMPEGLQDRLRLDADRHLRLRLASALANRSAQQLVGQALDRFLGAMPEVETLAAQLPPQKLTRSKGKRP